MPFIHMSTLARAVKQAYKNSNIAIGNFAEGYVLHAGPFTLWFHKDTTPKKVKAIIAGTIGKLPDAADEVLWYGEYHEGEPTEVGKDELEMIIKVVISPIMAPDPVGYKETIVTLGNKVLLQNLTDAEDIISVPAGLAALLDANPKYDKDLSGDSISPVGPFCYDGSHWAYWTSPTCRLAVHMAELDELERGIVNTLRESWDSPTVLYRKD